MLFLLLFYLSSLFLSLFICLFIYLYSIAYIFLLIYLFIYSLHYILVYMRLYVYRYVCRHVCMYMRIYVCIYVCMRICMYIRMYVCISVCIAAYIHVYNNTNQINNIHELYSRHKKTLHYSVLCFNVAFLLLFIALMQSLVLQLLILCHCLYVFSISMLHVRLTCKALSMLTKSLYQQSFSCLLLLSQSMNFASCKT